MAGLAFATPAGSGDEGVGVKTGFAVSTPASCCVCNGLVVQSSAAYREDRLCEKTRRRKSKADGQ